MHSSRRSDIQMLRALAVLSVVFFHLNGELLPYGFLGVDIFFVISGYVISLGVIDSYKQGKSFSAASFLSRRISRLMPALAATVAMTGFFALMFFSPSQLKDFSFASIYALAGLSNIYFFSEFSYFSAPLAEIPLLHTWSLSVEEQFYLMFAFTGVILLRPKQKGIIVFTSFWFLAVVISLCFVVFAPNLLSFFYDSTSAGYPADVESFVFYQLPTRVYQLGLGILLASWTRSSFLPRLWPCAAFLISVLSFVSLLCLFYWGAGSDELNMKNFYASVIAGIALMSGTSLASDKRHASYATAKISQALISIGNGSYSIYLVHWPVVAYWSLMISSPDSAADYALLLVITTIFSWCLYHGVERHGKSTGSRSKQLGPQPYLIYGLLFICATSAFLVSREGWPERLGDRVALYEEMAENGSKFHAAYYGAGTCVRDSECNSPESPIGRITLIGDSHVRHFADSFVNFFRDYSIYTVDLRCGVTGVTLCKSRKASAANIEKKISSISDISCNKNDLIVLGQRWWNMQSAVDFADSNAVVRPDASELSLYLKETIDALSPCKVLITGRVPELSGSNSESCLLSPIQPLSCGFTPMSKKQKSLQSINSSLALLESDRVYFLDPYETLCNLNGCTNRIDGYPVYSDSDHLSIWGGAAVLRQHQDSINEFILRQ